MLDLSRQDPTILAFLQFSELALGKALQVNGLRSAIVGGAAWGTSVIKVSSVPSLLDSFLWCWFLSLL